MSKIRSSVKSRRLVRRNRTWFRALYLTGMTSTELKQIVDGYGLFESAISKVKKSLFDFGVELMDYCNPIFSNLEVTLSEISEDDIRQATDSLNKEARI